jgi:hypothetical protein
MDIIIKWISEEPILATVVTIVILIIASILLTTMSNKNIGHKR